MLKKLLSLSLMVTTSLMAMEQYTEVNIPVLKYEPIEKNITKRFPYEDCKYVVAPKQESYVKKVVKENKYAALGGVIASQLGGGQIQIASAVVGTIVGSKFDEKPKPEMDIITQKDETNHYQEECVVRYRQVEEKKIVGYKNIGKYENIKIVKVSEAPLEKIKLKLNLVY